MDDHLEQLLEQLNAAKAAWESGGREAPDIGERWVRKEALISAVTALRRAKPPEDVLVSLRRYLRDLRSADDGLPEPPTPTVH